jgi:hypothetical protein
MRLLEYNDEGEFSLTDSFGDETHSISYFHTREKQFSRGSGDVCHAGKFFTSCAVQLARNVPQIQRFISDAVTEQKDIANQSLRDQWRQLTLGPLSRLDSSSSPSSYILIVDALDECGSEDDIRMILHPRLSPQLATATQYSINIGSQTLEQLAPWTHPM